MTETAVSKDWQTVGIGRIVARLARRAQRWPMPSRGNMGEVADAGLPVGPMRHPLRRQIAALRA